MSPTVIFRTHSDIEANIVRGLLQAHGIWSILASDVPHSIFPLSVDGLGEVRISVHPDEAEEATRIIEAHRTDIRKGKVIRLNDQFARLEERVGYRFRDRGLLEHALTHSSHAQEDVTGAVTDNESLEFLGDSVLGFVVADLLFRKFPTYTEGQKSKMKAMLVSKPALAQLAADIDLGGSLLLGRGEEKTGGRQKHALLADTYEALIAAVFLDGGIDAAHAFITRQFEPLIDRFAEDDFPARDDKSALQEWLQARGLPPPQYRVAEESGPPQRRVFTVEVRIQGQPTAEASGHSKKDAEQRAARLALEKLGKER
ncbi:MAG: ribonuclease III [Acidobacteria bacterium]|nr:ribonuclease III [Acidobacteriota bacterium]